MQKILIATGIFPPDIGGPATYCNTISQALSRHGFDVEIITYGNKRKLKALNSKLKIFTVSRRWPWFIKNMIYATKIFFSGKNNKIIYALNTLNGGIPAFFSAKVFKKKFFIRIAGDYAWQVGAKKGRTSPSIDDFQK